VAKFQEIFNLTFNPIIMVTCYLLCFIYTNHYYWHW